MRFFFVVQNATPVANEIQLFLARICNSRANTPRIDRQFTKAGYAEREPRLLVTLTKNRSVMARAAAKVAWMLTESGNVAVQPSRLDASLLREQSGLKHQKHQDKFVHLPDLRCV
jgi:hypothetical protein